MKVWKSPVFYLGILLALSIAMLLAAPYVIDWNAYRADLEDYGKTLTGRSVKIAGPISAEVFPWPRLTAQGVTIANPPGLENPEFARADRVVVRMTLAGLVRGGIDVESIDVERPVIGLERLATGEGNWVFTPAADLVRSDILSRVSLDRITLRGGTLQFRDRRRGETMTLSDFNASLASPGIDGPWRLRAVTLYEERALDLSVNTGVRVTGEPFRFGVRVASADGSGLVFSFDGAHDGTAANGSLRVEPATTGSGKSDAEGALRPLVFTAKVKADFDDVTLEAMEIGPSDPKQGGAITTGSASLRLGRHIEARAELRASMLDLDALAGAGSRGLLREAGSLALADRLLGMLPADMSFAGSIGVTALKTGGETLDNVELAIEADRNALRIGRFAVGFPGRSQALFKGVYFPDAEKSELAGDLALESSDVRALAQWAWPEAREAIASVWTGDRGRLKLQTDVSIAPESLRLSKMQYELDGERGAAELSLSTAGRGSVDLRIDGGSIDIDSYVPQGFSTVSAAASGGAAGLGALLLPTAEAPDLRLTLQAARLLLNGVTASDVALDVQAGAHGLDLRALDIGSVGGARLEATGLIIDSGTGADGSIGLQVKAEDPRELLRLLGVIRGGDYPDWSRDLGPADIRGNVAVKPLDGGSSTSVGLEGTAGAFSLSAQGTVSPRMDVSLRAMLAARSSDRLAALLGLVPATEGGEAGRIDLQAAGTLKDGFMVDASAQAYGARLDYRGSLDPNAPGYGLGGKLSLRSTEVAALGAASGLPVATPLAGVLSAEAGITSTEGGSWSFADIGGRLGDRRFSGKAELAAGMSLSGSFETGPLSLADVTAPVFLGWTGAAPDLEAGFADALPFGLTGELWIRPESLAIHRHFTARNAEIGITASKDEIRLAAFGKDESGRDALFEIAARPGDTGGAALTGKIAIPVDLEKQLVLAGGAPIASGLGMIEVGFEAEGRSAGGALAGLRGSGSYDFADFRLLGVSPDAFTSALAEAKDGAGITAAFDALRGGAGLAFGPVKGSITIADGEVGLLPFSHKSADADVQVKTVAELGLGEIDAEVTLLLKARPDLPPMTISYAGAPSALARGEDNSELSTKLGVAIMQQGIDELERLQEEQKRLAAQEEQQRIEDEERLQAYYAQRDELLLRRRELKVHSEMRAFEAERLRQQIEAERAANAEISKDEVKQRQRELRVHRRLARLAQAQTRERERAAAAARPAAPAKPAAPATVEPVILVKPEGAPVILSPDGDASPSQ